MKIFFSLIGLMLCITLQSQNNMNDSLPYASIPEAPETYTAGAVVSRMVDGLGFRYYWATKDLTDTDLDYTPGNEGRTIRQTITHIYSLSQMIVNSAEKQPIDRTVETPKMTIDESRRATLMNLKKASEIFADSENLEAHSLVFKSSQGEFEFPFWNNINGPIADAIWHAGQIVVLRRSAGNPINARVNVFLGKLNEDQ